MRVSQDGQKWENPMFVEDNTLGAASGEATCLRFKETYLNTLLGDVIPYRVK